MLSCFSYIFTFSINTSGFFLASLFMNAKTFVKNYHLFLQKRARSKRAFDTDTFLHAYFVRVSA